MLKIMFQELNSKYEKETFNQNHNVFIEFSQEITLFPILGGKDFQLKSTHLLM